MLATTRNTTRRAGDATPATAPTPRGRPTVLSLRKRCLIVGAFAHGLSPTDAAHIAGVAPSVLTRWLARGHQETDSVFGELATLADAIRALHQPHDTSGASPDPESSEASATSTVSERASE